jgi:hypothetical protein
VCTFSGAHVQLGHWDSWASGYVCP